MAIYPENYEGKLIESKFRNRGEEVGERKLTCPYCGKSGITYRKLVQDHAWEAESSVIGIQCGANRQVGKCMYLCRSGVFCFLRHLKAYHDGDKDTEYFAVAIDILDVEKDDKHTGHCMFLSKIYADEVNKKKEQIKIARMLVREMKAKQTRELKVRQNKRKLNLEARLVQKAIVKNYQRNKNSIFEQDRSRRTKF